MTSRTAHEVLVSNLRLKDLALGRIEDEDGPLEFPETVFPVKIDIKLARTKAEDETVEDSNGHPIKPKDYPAELRVSAPAPYMPQTTVHFENPVEYPKSGIKWWRFEEFLHQVQKALDRADQFAPTGGVPSDRFYFSKMTLCEVPEQYVFRGDDGRYNVETDMYEERAEVHIGRFTQRPKITDEEVRDDMGDALPGRVLKPLRLTRIRQCNVKETRGGSEALQHTKTRYFTEGQAKQYSNLKLAPRDRDLRDGDSIRWANARKAFPKLAASEFLGEWELDIEEEETTRERVVGARKVQGGGAKKTA